jgi:hypothetical protein
MSITNVAFLKADAWIMENIREVLQISCVGEFIKNNDVYVIGSL